MTPLAAIPPEGMFVVGVLLLVVVLMRRWARYQRRGRPEQPRTRPPRPPSQQPRKSAQPLLDAPPDIIRWQVEMQDLARDLKGELDTKMAALLALLRHAREEAERLEHLVSEARRVPSSRPTGVDSSDDTFDLAIDQEPRQLADPASLMDPQDRRKVCQLADLGVRTEAIAQRVGVPVGDVELVLSLRHGSDEDWALSREPPHPTP